jgi:hypothetical protein
MIYRIYRHGRTYDLSAEDLTWYCEHAPVAARATAEEPLEFRVETIDAVQPRDGGAYMDPHNPDGYYGR